MQADNLDALVLVHPDFETPTEEYLKNVSTLVQEYRKAGKPIFVIDDEPVNTPEMRRIVYSDDGQGSYSLPVGHQNGQDVVDFISKKVGKKPQDISLGFGGIFANHCVHAFAAEYCKVVETNHRNEEAEPLYSPINPIAFGKVFDEIVLTVKNYN
jgi:hypothetical protein